MVKEQYIDIDPLPGMYKPWWFRYSESMRRQLDQFISFVHAPSLKERIRGIPGALALLWHRNRVP